MLARALLVITTCASLGLVVVGAGPLGPEYREDQQAWMVYPTRCMKVVGDTKAECPMENGLPQEDKCVLPVRIVYPIGPDGQPDRTKGKLVSPMIKFDPNCQWATMEVRKIK